MEKRGDLDLEPLGRLFSSQLELTCAETRYSMLPRVPTLLDLAHLFRRASAAAVTVLTLNESYLQVQWWYLCTTSVGGFWYNVIRR